MNRPPMLMHIKVHNRDDNFGIWLPLFLLFPLALVVLLILSPLILIALLVIWCCGWGNWLRYAGNAIAAAFNSLCAMRGLNVDIQNRQGYVNISVI
jgi:hypothetical protein